MRPVFLCFDNHHLLFTRFDHTIAWPVSLFIFPFFVRATSRPHYDFKRSLRSRSVQMSTLPERPQGGPNIALIPLPPGFTLQQFFAFQSSLVSISLTAAIAFGIVVWDYFYLLPDEYKFYQRAKKAEWRTMLPYSFMILRCSGVVSVLASMCISSLQSDHCQVGLVISQIAAVIAVATSGIAFGHRALSVWGEQSRLVAWPVAAAYLLMVIAVSSQYRARNGPPTPFGSNCRILPFPSWAPLSHASSALFNAAVLVLMLRKSIEHGAQKSSISSVAFRNSVSPMAIATGASVTVMVIHALAPEHQLAKQLVLPFSTLITATMGARVFLAHRLSRAPSPRVQQSALGFHHSTGYRSGSDGANTTVHYNPKSRPGEVAYVLGTASPRVVYSTDTLETKGTSNPYTTFPSPPQRYAPSPSVTPAPSSRRSSYNSHQDTDGPSTPLMASASAGAGAQAVVAITHDLPQNPYTTFPPPPPSPSRVPQIVVRDASIDSATPLLKTMFGVPSLAGRKPRKGDDDHPKSAWV
ncbi:hypothetical protein D9615_008577 [Tricholomella constricta]|uniref:Uncharacterized protein n=1 Tax=Tricholomella constricta TaxID=117010 RepID=A0A8H5H4D5_9AGAR|nr:hypothetical protein D9615_008577 [Tricholomella constricta]